MKKYFLIITLLLFSTVLYAQNPLKKGAYQLNGGFGFSDWGVPVYLGIDYGIDQDISIGGEFSFRSYSEDYSYYYHNYSSDHTIIGISGNANYHFNRVLKISRQWDFYAGLNIGFFIWSSSGDYHGDHTSGLGLGAQIGGRYYFSDKFGLNLEFGGGNAFAGGKIGVSIKL
jgi:outer membrane immunogenic protein